MMKSQRKKIPLVRVKGFEGAWELCTLGEHIEDYVEKTTVQNQYPVLTSSQNKGIVRQEDYFANRQVTTDSNIGYFVLPKGFFTYRSRSDNGVFKFNRNDLLDKGIISYFYPVFSIVEGDSDFYLKLLNTSITKQVMLQAEGTGQKVLSLSKFKSIKTLVPSLPEQSAIGSLFRTLDDLLTSYKDNLANYQSLKATMLSKMFPKAGQRVPEIRLDGFEDEWVEKRLKDISKRVTRKNNDLVSERALTISAQFGLIDQEEFFQKKIASKDVSGYYLIKKGEFAYNKSYSTGYPLGAIKRLDKYENGVLSTLYILFKTVDVDSDYLAHYYESDKWHREVSMCAAEGARNHGLLNIAPADFFNTRLVIPKELEEQQAIGAYFSNLDSIINSYQEKITQLETLKKKLLQDMFI